jgi:hypothetical protein
MKRNRFKVPGGKLRYNLVCIAPDGDHVTEICRTSYGECIKRSQEMGSRWYFYPFHVVTTPSNKTVADAFGDMEPYIGKRLKTLKTAIAQGEFNHWLEA